MRYVLKNPSTSFEVHGRGNGGRPRLLRPIRVTPEDELEFQGAMEHYKRRSGRQFPTWSEILEVLRDLGYAKRIWRPIVPDVPPAPDPGGSGGCFEAMGEDSGTGLLCWYSRVETPAGSRSEGS
jgi:hypothetical protein